MPHEPPAENPNDPARDRDATPTEEQTQRLVREAEPFLDLAQKCGVSCEDSSPVAQPFQFEELSRLGRLPAELDGSGDSMIRLDVELGETRLGPGDVAKLAAGSLISLNALANEPVDVFADGRLVARAEVVTVDQKPGLRIVEIL